MVIDHADPTHKELAFLLVALNRLRCGNDRHPFLYVLLFGLALSAEKVKILIRKYAVSVKAEQEVGSCYVSRSVTLSCMRPVNDIRNT